MTPDERTRKLLRVAALELRIAENVAAQREPVSHETTSDSDRWDSHLLWLHAIRHQIESDRRELATLVAELAAHPEPDAGIRSRNMFGISDCPKCGCRFRWPTQPIHPKYPNMILCDSCDYKVPIKPDESNPDDGE